MKEVASRLVNVIMIVMGAVSCIAAMDRNIEKEVTVNGSLEEVWNAWTTNAGAQTFFSWHTNIYPKLGPPYEIYFSPQKPYGQQGSEGCRVHSLVPMQLLAFTWNAPPQLPTLREGQLHTIVYLQFSAVGSETD